MYNFTFSGLLIMEAVPISVKVCIFVTKSKNMENTQFYFPGYKVVQSVEISEEHFACIFTTEE
jgi:hypothetical protein